MHDGEAERASLVDSNLVSLGPSVGGGGGGGMTAPSSRGATLQSTAGGVISMVTTPFRSKSNQDLRHGFAPPSSKPSRSSSSFRGRKLKVLTSTDPSALKEEVLSELSPDTTIVVSLDLDVDREREREEITLAVRDWLLSGLLGSDATGGSKEGVNNNRSVQADVIGQKHMFLVTGKESSKRSNPNTFFLPRHSRCEAFATLSSAGLLPLSFIFGWKIASSILSGAHDMDQHFVDTNPRHNLPLILALIDLWNDSFLQSHGRIVSPHAQAFGSYPAFVSAMENKVLNGCGKVPAAKVGSASRKQGPSPVIDGGSLSLDHGSHGLSAEFLTAFDPPNKAGDNFLVKHDRRICSLFAHADTMAFGSSNSSSNRRFELSSPGSPPMIQSVDSMISHGSTNVADATNISGNRPSTLIACGTCDAFTCGQLIALEEHRALAKAWLFDIDPFVTAKSTIQEERQGFLSDKLHRMNHLLLMGENLEEATPERNGANVNDMNDHIHSSTKAVLAHYATRVQKHRDQSAPRTPLRVS
mmetsp:Transcript_7508/g.18625  ORF Transcript_7508/g.18625 Transcript_7508/m.18625 type:complete len:528 (-) Transcript_7508:278-1861(-)